MKNFKDFIKPKGDLYEQLKPENGEPEGTFVKKPVPVHAYQTDKDIMVKTLEGPVKAKKGCWICTGHRGDQWPVDPKVFVATYSRVSTTEVEGNVKI